MRWGRIAPSVSNRTEAIEVARFTLADIVLGLAKHGNFDPQWLADAAVQVMLSRKRRGPRKTQQIIPDRSGTGRKLQRYSSARRAGICRAC